MQSKHLNGQLAVCMLCDLYLPFFSGASHQAHRLAKSLVERNVQVLVIAGRYPGTAAQDVVEGIPVRRMRLLNSELPLARPFSMALGALPILFKERHHFDILHIHGNKVFSFLPLGFARLLGKKTVIKMTLLGSPDDPATWPGNPLGPLMRLSFVLADRVVSISTPLSDNYQRSGLDPARLRKMPQGVDVSRFHPVAAWQKKEIRAALGLRHQATYLSFVGSFKQRKGADILVEMFILLARQHPELHLLVVGPDAFDDPVRAKRPYVSDADALKQAVQRAGVIDRVVFTGQVSNVHTFLQASDVFVFPSRREGFGTAIIEAMAVGLPCVISSLDGIAAEICSGENIAIIVGSEDPQDYVQQVADLLAHPHAAQEMGRRARQRVIAAYDIESVTEKYIGLYRNLCPPVKAGSDINPKS
ncbi:MAG: glycosyltransferase family 4 protein [Anaerolineales bacterium]|nr:glycosyltransferase family 4 protein [Anaerolineales bacterium]